MSGDAHALFRKQGYLIFENALNDDELTLLRTTCNTLLSERVDDGGGAKHKIGLGTARRFLAHRHEDFPEYETFLLSTRIAEITAVCGLDEPMLFNEQFVVKGARKGASFAWHQDGAYVGFDHTPYLTIWVAQDDATLENGCVYVLPRDLDKQPNLEPHEWQETRNELNGYTGSETGTPMTCLAGSIVVFSSLTLHRSGENKTNASRRALVCQYSSGALIDPATGSPKRFAKPLLAH